MKFFTYYKFSLIGLHLTTEADDRRTIKSADFITRFYWPIPLAKKIEQVLLLNLSPKYRAIKSVV